MQVQQTDAIFLVLEGGVQKEMVAAGRLQGFLCPTFSRGKDTVAAAIMWREAKLE